MNHPIPFVATPANRLVEFLSTLSAENLPSELIRKARMCLCDSLGCGLYGATTDSAKIAADVVYEEESRGRATVYGRRSPVAPARAALVNGTATHGFELDDIAPGNVHAAATAVPAVLALAEQFELSGKQLLIGVVAGYEATSRISMALGRAVSQHNLGFHIPAVTGAVGSAMAAGVTLNLPHEQILCAVGIAASSASGILSFVQGTGGMTKRMHGGRAAESGVLACLLARRGFTGPLAALDGKLGFLEVFGAGKADASALDAGLGEEYAINRTWTKVYPLCGGLQALTQALFALRTENGISHQDVKQVRLGVKHRALKVHADVDCTDSMAAQYSMPFCAAVALVKEPKDPDSFIGDALTDPVVRDLARRVELYFDEEMENAIYPRNAGARVEVKLKDGRSLHAKIFDAHGMPDDPCSEDEILAKFRRLAAAALTDKAVDEVAGLIGRIETLNSIAPLSQALRAGARA